MSTKTRILLAALLALAATPAGVRAQQPTPTPADSITPMLAAMAVDPGHARQLYALYSEAILRPLFDHYDHGVAGGFPEALRRARAAGVPEELLVEAELMRAIFDGDFPALRAAQPRLQAVLASWQEKNSMFSTRDGLEALVKNVNLTVALEAVSSGAFARCATNVRKRSIARAVKNDLDTVDRCLDQYAIIHRCHMGDPIPLEGWLAYAPTKAHVWANRGADVLGHAFGPQRVGTPPAVPAETYRLLADAVPDSFWAPFAVTGAAAQR